jgi:hypothetical protein
VRREITRHVCFQQPRTGLNHASSFRHSIRPAPAWPLGSGMGCSICGFACDPRRRRSIAAFGCRSLTWCCAAFGGVGLAAPLRLFPGSESARLSATARRVAGGRRQRGGQNRVIRRTTDIPVRHVKANKPYKVSDVV